MRQQLWSGTSILDTTTSPSSPHSSLTSLLPTLISFTVRRSAVLVTRTVSGSATPDTTVSPRPQLAVMVSLPLSPVSGS